MVLTYEYRIQPNNHQEALLLKWLEPRRRHWNSCWRQRLDWLHRTRCFIDRCSLVSQPIGEIPECPNYYSQLAQLKQTKELFPEYKEIYHEVQQQN
ncbi:helix-turn-helix domain-containing protein [Thermosynechococcus sp. HN-54]|uniref:helix-turn-helix domain-containing protein n=1 Tax=Thermosynechococcus sp. HN-54 TaxID=2933959 RepID=UPI0028F41901|nr:helix-turn-helix domain-containing protein [Thermosynechococcus sp. HN-54]